MIARESFTWLLVAYSPTTFSPPFADTSELILRMSITDFDPDVCIPDLSRKTILVTGGNSGLGAECCLQFAKHGSPRIFLGARSRVKAETAIASIKTHVPHADITLLDMDLSDLSSVKQAAESFLAVSSRLDILMNNAGYMLGPPALTKDGFEIRFGTNHMGHALLTKLLLPVLVDTARLPDADVRIVNVSSRGHKWANKGLLLESACTSMSSISVMKRYAHSKLANIFFTQELAKRYPIITSVSLHPGDVQTNILQSFKDSYPWIPEVTYSILAKWFALTVEQGALTQLWASVSPEAQSGMYYEPVGKVGSVIELVNDQGNAPKLWDWTEAELQKRGF